MMTEVFTIAPASSKALYAIAAVLLLLVGMVALFGFFVYSSHATQFELTGGALRVGRSMYGRSIPYSRLDISQAQVVNLHGHPDFQPTLRTNGIGLPGYQAGWFSLRKGRGLLFVTDPTSVVAIPTREGYTLLLSVADPASFLEALRRKATR